MMWVDWGRDMISLFRVVDKDSSDLAEFTSNWVCYWNVLADIWILDAASTSSLCTSPNLCKEGQAVLAASTRLRVCFE